jgi:hypothetical protein
MEEEGLLQIALISKVFWVWEDYLLEINREETDNTWIITLSAVSMTKLRVRSWRINKWMDKVREEGEKGDSLVEKTGEIETGIIRMEILQVSTIQMVST